MSETKNPAEKSSIKAAEKTKPAELHPSALEDKNLKIKKDSQDLECILTDQEKLAYGKELAKTLLEKSVAEGSLKTYQTQAKADIAKLDAGIEILREKVNNGKEFRKVDILVTTDFTAKEKRWLRLDTKEVFKTDIIPESELQEHLAI